MDPKNPKSDEKKEEEEPKKKGFDPFWDYSSEEYVVSFGDDGEVVVEHLED